MTEADRAPDRVPGRAPDSARDRFPAGYRLLVPVHHIEAAFVRSHYSSVEVGVQDAPRPNELLFALVMGTGPRVHARIGGLQADQISAHDGHR